MQGAASLDIEEEPAALIAGDIGADRGRADALGTYQDGDTHGRDPDERSEEYWDIERGSRGERRARQRDRLGSAARSR